jgi:hypothetical protein
MKANRRGRKGQYTSGTACGGISPSELLGIFLRESLRAAGAGEENGGVVPSSHLDPGRILVYLQGPLPCVNQKRVISFPPRWFMAFPGGILTGRITGGDDEDDF